MDKAAAAKLGAKFGESLNDYTKASENTIEAILIEHCNNGIKLMSDHIKKKARTGQASTLASSMDNIPVKISATKFQVKTISSEYYYDYVDKGVQGVYDQTKAPNSKYKFKNLGVPKKMWKSFLSYVARSGTQEVKGITTSRKGKSKIKGIKDNITVAKGLAVATKISGIKPMDFISKADNEERTKELARNLAAGLGKAMAKNIKISINGN